MDIKKEIDFLFDLHIHVGMVGDDLCFFNPDTGIVIIHELEHDFDDQGVRCYELIDEEDHLGPELARFHILQEAMDWVEARFELMQNENEGPAN